MSKAKDSDQSPQPFALRRGVGEFPGLGGLHRRGDPGCMPPGAAYHAINVRLGDEVVNRPGLAKITTTTPDGEAFGLKEYGLDSRGAILVSHQPVREVWGYNPDWNPIAQDLELDEVVSPGIESSLQTMAIYRDAMHFVGLSDGTYYLYAVALPNKSELVSRHRTYARVAQFPTDRVPAYLYSGDQALWIGCTTGHVMRFDGALSDTTRISPAVGASAVVVEFREKTYAFATQEAKVLNEDDEWVAISVASWAGLGVTAFVPEAAESVNDYLYVVGRSGTDVVALRWDGSTWTLKASLTTDDAPGSYGGVDVREWNGKAVWAYNRPYLQDEVPSGGAFVASIEDDTEKSSLGATFTGLIGSIVVSAGYLYACITEDPGAGTPQTRLLRLDSDAEIAGWWTSEEDFDGWSLLWTWDDYGSPAGDMVDVLPL